MASALLGAAALMLAWLVAVAAPAGATATASVVTDPDAFVCHQRTSIGFEDFSEGTNLSAQSFDGVDFTTTGGYTWQVADYASGNYNGKYPNGAYTGQGTHVAWLGESQGYGRISFANRTSTVSLLISSYTPITMEAYDVNGNLLESTPFSHTNTNTGKMDLLTIARSRADIASVVVHDSGGYFVVDSLCTDASVTTPGTDLAIGQSAADPVAVGDTQTFAIDVTNNGPLDADGVVVSDVVPQAYSVTSAVPSQGTCPSVGNNVACDLGTLAVGDFASVTVTAQAVTAGAVSNLAQVSSADGDVDVSNNSSSLTTTINGSRACTITGTARNDVLDGTPGDDVICGLAGNDTIRSSGGDDVVIGGPGADTMSYALDPGPVQADMLVDSGTTSSGTQDFVEIENLYGSPGADRLGGDDLNNTINGGAGDDFIFGHAGNDLERGSDGDDQLFGGTGGNGLDGGSGVDKAYYSGASGPVTVDLLTGAATSTIALSDTVASVENVSGSKFDDVIGGDDGPNLLEGGQGNDRLYGHDGDDQMVGASGNDFISGATGSNTLDGGNGIDTVSYGSASAPITASLVLGTGTGTGIDDQLSGFENLAGSRQDDTLTGDAGRNVIQGGQGDDLISGKGGNDQILGQLGVDRASFSGAPAPVTANLAAGRASGEGTDILDSIEGLIGSAFNDQLYGSNSADTLDGGVGSDLLRAQGGPDVLTGGGGNDTMEGGSGNDDLSGGIGNDGLDGGLNTDTCAQGPGSGRVVNCEN